jgi:hypothetical protein
MRKLQVGTILLGVIVFAPVQAALGQEVAYANESRPGYVIFFSNGPAHLSNVAVETIQMAAAEADRSDGLVRLVGPVGYATVVKDELVRGGVPARAIVVVPRTASALPAIGDGVGEPASVEIHYWPGEHRRQSGSNLVASARRQRNHSLSGGSGFGPASLQIQGGEYEKSFDPVVHSGVWRRLLEAAANLDRSGTRSRSEGSLYCPCKDSRQCCAGP